MYPPVMKPDGRAQTMQTDREVDQADIESIVLADGGVSQTEADAIAQPCPNLTLNIGVFFDGTWNSMNNAEAGFAMRARGEDTSKLGSYDTSVTHPAHLSTRYFDPSDSDPGKVAYERVYIEGVGARTGGEDAKFLSGATGIGLRGVGMRLSYAKRRIAEIIADHSAPCPAKEIFLDVFGFSRGAATARIFCNEIKLRYGNRATIRFLGLFDTVAAIGIPSDEISEAGYNLNVGPNNAVRIVHLTAHHEIRENSVLTSIGRNRVVEIESGIEFALPGVHGTIGGSARDYEVPLPIRFPQDLEILVAQGILPPDIVVPERRQYETTTNADDFLNGNPGAVYHTDVGLLSTTIMIKPGLRMLSLEVMYEYAIRAGVPFHSLDPAMPLPARFQPLKAKALNGEALTDADMALARGYIVPSAAPWSAANNPENDYVRDVISNAPSRAESKPLPPPDYLSMPD